MPRRFSRSSCDRARSRAFGFLLIAGLAIGAASAASAAERTVAIEGVKYEPAALTVARGDTVVWVNKDPFPHTVTAHGAFDSHEIAPGKSWKWVARRGGTFEYVCTLHPTMKGTLRVE